MLASIAFEPRRRTSSTWVCDIGEENYRARERRHDAGRSRRVLAGVLSMPPMRQAWLYHLDAVSHQVTQESIEGRKAIRAMFE